jgi:intein/homing endonuclease
MLKARQWGGSTETQGWLFEDTILRKGRRSLTIAHDIESANHLRDMSERYYDNYPLPKPIVKKMTDKTWKFKHQGLESTMRIDTAQNLSAGHSLTINNLHACLHPDTPVLVESGKQKRIADVVIGDRVITHNGNYGRVILNTKKTWEELPSLGETVVIHPWLGTPVEMTPEHKVFTNRGWVKAGEITKDDMLAMPVRKITDRIKSLPVNVDHILRRQSGGMQRFGNDSFPINEETGYFVGYYLAEGCNSKDRFGSPSMLTFAFCQGEKEYADRAIEAVKPFIRRDVDYRLKKDSKTETIRFSNVALCGMIDECFGSKDEKRIPDWVFDCGVEFCRGLVAGYLSGDGSKTPATSNGKYTLNRVSATSTRESITYQIRDLVAALGIGWGSVSERREGVFYGRNCKRVWTVAFNGDTAKGLREIMQLKTIESSGIGIRSQKFSIADGYVWIKIKKLAKSFCEEVYDLAIDHDDHSFRTPSFSVSNSELQQWDHGETILRGLMPTIPNDPDTMVIEEGTGSGVGDFWYDRIQEAMGEQKTWEFVFVPWFELDDAQVNFENGDKFSFEKSLDVDEKLLFEGGVTLERLNWRRWKLGSEFRSDPEGFKQQYPSNPDEAFLSSGRPVFRPEKVRERMLRSKPPIRQGYLERRGGKVILVDDPSGYWKLWEEPVIGKKNLYALGEDGSQGKAIIPQLGGKGCDYSAARIFRRDTRKFVATFHARLDPDVVSQEVEMASEYFGGRENVGTLIEENPQGGGNLTIRALKHSPHVRLLRTPVLNKRADFNKDDEYGWFTKTNTKRLLVDEMKEAIREGTYEDFDKETWYECSTYVHDEKGGADAQKGKFDDLVMATGITLQADKLMPLVFASVAEKKERYAKDIDVPKNFTGVVTKESVMEENYANF